MPSTCSWPNFRATRSSAENRSSIRVSRPAAASTRPAPPAIALWSRSMPMTSAPCGFENQPRVAAGAEGAVDVDAAVANPQRIDRRTPKHGNMTRQSTSASDAVAVCRHVPVPSIKRHIGLSPQSLKPAIWDGLAQHRKWRADTGQGSNGPCPGPNHIHGLTAFKLKELFTKARRPQWNLQLFGSCAQAFSNHLRSSESQMRRPRHNFAGTSPMPARCLDARGFCFLEKSEGEPQC